MKEMFTNERKYDEQRFTQKLAIIKLIDKTWNLP